MKKLSSKVVLVASLMFIVLLGCAAGDVTRWNAGHAAGFWAGLWHGMISIVTLIISLFSKSVKVYECYNNGGWYDFGFLLGVILIWGGGCGASARASRRKRRSQDTCSG